MKDAMCKRCGQVHKKPTDDKGFSVLRSLDKISGCCTEPFYIWCEEGSLYDKET